MADTNLWSSILDTTGNLIGLGTQSLANDGIKIKGEAETQLLKLRNEGALSTQEYEKARLKIQTDRDAKLSELKLKERKQLYAAVGVLVGVVAIVAVVIVLIVRSSKS